MITDRYINPTILEWGVNVLAYGLPPVAGPYYVDAAQVFAPGAIEGDVFVPGAARGQVFTPGSVEGQVIA